MANDHGPCVVCGSPGLACARCRLAHYCGKQHQREHWPRHKAECGWLELRVDGALGRHFVAAKAIPARAFLLRERPLAVFPSAQRGPDQEPVCVGCCSSLEHPSACAICGWPVCDAACARRPEHRDECAAFKRAGFKLSSPWAARAAQWDALAALRVCLASARDPRLLNLQSELTPDAAAGGGDDDVTNNIGATVSDDAVMRLGFSDEALLRLGRAMHEGAVRAAVAWLRGTAGIRWLDEAALRRACGAVLINCFGTGHGVSNKGHSESGLYAGLSLLEHSCAPNCRSVRVDGEDSGEVVLVAARAIAQGEHVTIAYRDDPLAPLGRRRWDCATRGFACRCELCADPGERGTHFSAWCCTACTAKGTQSFVTVLGLSGWRCAACGASGREPEAAVSELSARLAELQVAVLLGGDPGGRRAQRSWRDFAEAALWPRGPLHPTHHLVVQARCELVGLGDNVFPPRQPSDQDEAASLVACCREVLRAVDAFRPPINAYRREVVCWLHRLLTEELLLLARQRGTGRLKKAALAEKMQACRAEIEELCKEIDHISLSPRERMTAQELKMTLCLLPR